MPHVGAAPAPGALPQAAPGRLGAGSQDSAPGALCAKPEYARVSPTPTRSQRLPRPPRPPPPQVEANSKFVDLGADSLDTVEIMMALEEKFDIQLDEEGAEKISTVQEAADLIAAQIDK